MLIIGWIQVDEIHLGEFPQEVAGILAPHLNIPRGFKPHGAFNFNPLRDSVQGVSTFTTPTTFVKALEDTRRICVNTRLYQEWPEAVRPQIFRDTPSNVVYHPINTFSIFRCIKPSITRLTR